MRSIPSCPRLNLLTLVVFWLVREFPWRIPEDPAGSPDEDPDGPSVGYGMPHGSVGQWRDGILNILEQRGTWAAVAALSLIATSYPEHQWLVRHVRAAERTARHATWHPITSEELLALVERRERRIITTSRQLLEVVLESLDRFQKELQGETPAAPDLWNELSKGTYRPRGEGFL